MFWRKTYTVNVASDQLAEFMKVLLNEDFMTVTVRTDWLFNTIFVFKLSRKQFQRFASTSLSKFAS